MKSGFHFKCPVCNYECHPDVDTFIQDDLQEMFDHLANHIKELYEKLEVEE